MNRIRRKEKPSGQTAIEYLILLGIVTAVALIGFHTFVPQSRQYTEQYFNQVTNRLYGATPVTRTLNPGIP
jgi:Flp pilus assembly pilin Flp